MTSFLFLGSLEGKAARFLGQIDPDKRLKRVSLTPYAYPHQLKNLAIIEFLVSAVVRLKQSYFENVTLSCGMNRGTQKTHSSLAAQDLPRPKGKGGRSCK